MNRDLKSVYCYFLSERFSRLSRQNKIKFILPPYIEDKQVSWVERYIKPYLKYIGRKGD